MNIPEKEQYKYLTHHLEYLNDKILGSFELFIKLATAIIGGVFLLHWKLAENHNNGDSLVLMSDMLFCIVGVSIIALIWINLCAWRSYRKTLSKEYPAIKLSNPFLWWIGEAIMSLLIIITCILFCLLNPLNSFC